MSKIFFTIFCLVLGISLSAQEDLQQGTQKRGRLSERVQKQLNLTDNQVAQWETILKENRQKKRDILQDAQLTREEKLAKSKVLRQEREAAITQLLTPEQLDKYKQNKEIAKERRAERKDIRKQRIEEHKAELGLTEDQATKLQQLKDKQRQQVQSIRQQEGLSKDQKKAQIKELNQKYKDEIRGLLTPEQYEKMEQMKKERREARKDRPRGHGPKHKRRG